MKVMLLCKRHYTGQDVVKDKFGRLYEMPRQLAELGHEVDAFCLDYYETGKPFSELHDTNKGRLTWHSYSLGKYKQNILCYPFFLIKAFNKINPDLIIGASDIPHVFLAFLLSKKFNTPYVADLYDNFESFGQAKIPLFTPALKFAVKRADRVITVSKQLKNFVRENYQATRKNIDRHRIYHLQ